MPTLNAFVWNPYAREYVPVTGSAVDTDALRLTVEEVRKQAKNDISKLTKDLRNGDLTNLAEFKLGVKQALQNLYISTHVLARGGLDQMDNSTWGKLGASLKEQYGFLGDLVRDIENGRIGAKDPETGEVIVRESGIPELGDDFTSRMELYTDSAWGAAGEFETVVRDREAELGSLERRVLGASKESCDDCIAAADLGWQPPGVLPDIGDTECGPGCNCTFEFENADLNELNEAFG